VSQSPAQPARLSADIGGTFTDVVLESDGRRWSRKILTSHQAPEEALLEGIRATLSTAEVEVSQVEWFVHGMTLATNAILERRGAKTALVTTEGFRDVVEIGYEHRHDMMDLRLQKRPPLVGRELRFPVRERITAGGEIIAALDEAAIRQIGRILRSESVESVAIGFLHSYVNPSHERRARELLHEIDPELSITLSSEVCPEMREYERISTACANAYVQPLVTDYIERLERRLRELGLRCPLLLMASSGGVVPLDAARHIPIRLVESGPAGGTVLGATTAAAIGARDVLSFDMGGTTAKVCFIADGQPHIARLFEVDRSERFQKGSGLPVRIPVVELVEIAGGGGSIVSLDALERLAVGPQSAGSQPGPACYGKGGTDPTVTDADLLAGKVDPQRFAGGSIRLSMDKGMAAFDGVARQMSLASVQVAMGAIEMIDEVMANAARVHAAELGRDLESHVLVAFGGAAPLHAGRVAQKLGIRKVVIPLDAGVGSAVGFLRAPVGYDIVASRPMQLGEFDDRPVRELVADMERQAAQVVSSLGPTASGATNSLSAYMRYVGQGHEVNVPVEANDLSGATLHRAFETRYRELYGRVIPDAPVEVLSWQLSIRRETWRQPARDGAARQLSSLQGEAPRHRSAFDPSAGQFVDHRVVERSSLAQEAGVHGPALIVEDQTTVVVPRGFSAHSDEFSNVVLKKLDAN